MSDDAPQWIHSVTYKDVKYLYYARGDTGEVTSIKPDPPDDLCRRFIQKDAEEHHARHKHLEEVSNRLTILSIGEINQFDGPKERIGAKARYGEEGGDIAFTIEIVDAGPVNFEIHGTTFLDLYFFQIVSAFLRIINLPTTKVGDMFQLRDYC